MRIALAAAALGLLVLPAAASARPDSAAAPPFPVTILQGKPLPAKATIAVGGRVTWTNRDAKARRVKSDTNAWPAFTLRRGARKTVRFTRAGCYRYKVDGKAKGVVAVARTCGAAGGGGGGGGVQTFTYHYDVQMTGHDEYTRTITGDRADLNGVETVTADWTATYRDVVVKKVVTTVGASSSEILVNQGSGGGDLFARGTIGGQFSWSSSRDTSGPCQGNHSFAAYGTHFAAAASKNFNGPGHYEFRVDSQMDLDAGTKLSNELLAKMQPACDGFFLGSVGFPYWLNEEFTANGLEMTVFIGLLELTAERKRTSSFEPALSLLAGRGLTVDTGQRADERECGSTCKDESSGRIRIVLTPRR